MKKNIFAPDVRVIRFDSQDVIVTSPRVNDEPGDSHQLAPERTSIWD